MTQVVSNQAIFEHSFRWVVRVFFGMLLAISLYLLCFVVLIPITDHHGLASSWLPMIIIADFVVIGSTCLFYAWQKGRLPRNICLLGLDVGIGILVLLGLCWIVS